MNTSPAVARVHRLAGAYLVLQALAVLGWWALLLRVPASRAHFQFDSETALLAFWLPDLLLLAGGSLAAGLACLRRSGLTAPLAWLVTGGFGYATLYCIAGSALSDAGWPSVLLMAPASLVCAAIALALSPPSTGLFRTAAPASSRRNLCKTGAQILLFWGVLLFLVPGLLVELQTRLDLPPAASALHRWLGGALFLAFSALGLWSGWTMARLGRGTPLPLDAPRRLVVEGPYAYVRNPMAVAGLGQGLAVALLTGSVLVLGYVLLGALLWQHLVRPLEEEDLLRRFGAEYQRYRQGTRCWYPGALRLRPGGHPRSFSPDGRR